jgi:hypothetical protein
MDCSPHIESCGCRKGAVFPPTLQVCKMHFSPPPHSAVLLQTCAKPEVDEIMPGQRPFAVSVWQVVCAVLFVESAAPQHF